MPRPTRPEPTGELVDVREAAARAGRHPETIRRWVWSGRLPARREGGRLLVSLTDLEALSAPAAAVGAGLGAWAARARTVRARVAHADPSGAADLVLEDRARRSGEEWSDAGR